MTLSSDINRAATVEVDSISTQDWDRALQEFADATIYQTHAYGAVSWGESQLSRIILRLDGEVVAMAQLRIVSLPIIGRGVAYVRWGPLWRRKDRPDNPAFLSAITTAIRDEYAGRRKLLVRIIPHIYQADPESAYLQSWRELGLILVPDVSPYRTFRVDIAPSLDEIRKRFDGKWRNQLNRAEKNGLTIVEGADTAKYDIFLSLYNEMHARKGFDTSVDPAQFRRIQELLSDRQKMIILLAYKDAVPVSALVGSGVGDTGIYLLGATSNEGMQHKGSYLLQWRMIQRLKELGCVHYDLGGINPEKNPGVYHFKEGFSGDDVTLAGQFEMTGSKLSSWCVQAGERLRNSRRSFQKTSTPPAVETAQA